MTTSSTGQLNDSANDTMPSLTHTAHLPAGWAGLPLTQEEFAEPLLLQSPSTNSSCNRWAAATMTQQCLLSLTPPPICTQQGRLSIKTIESHSTIRAEPTLDNYVHSTETQYVGYWVWLHTWPLHSPMTQHKECWVWLSLRSLHSPMTQCRKCWVWLSTQASPQLSDSA